MVAELEDLTDLELRLHNWLHSAKCGVDQRAADALRFVVSTIEMLLVE